MEYDKFDLRQFLSDQIDESGFDVLYEKEVIKKINVVIDNPVKWNPIKYWIRRKAKKSDASSAGFIDDWIATLRVSAADSDYDGPHFDTGDHVEVAVALRDRVEKKGEVIFDLNSFYQYREGAVWEIIRERELSRTISSFSGAPVQSGGNKPPTPLRVSSGMIDGVIRIYRDHVDKSGDEASPGFFDSAPPGIMFSDCFMRVDLSSGNVYQENPSPKHRQSINAGCSFEGSTDAPIFDGYMSTCFEGDPDAEKKINLMMEFFGACLANVAAKYQRALILYDGTERSTGANGKSVFIKLMNATFPRLSRSSVSPVEFSERFTRAMLAGRRINFVTEMPDEHGVISGETTKSIITGEPIKAEHKNQTPFFFSPTAGHLFACNDFPSVSDNSDAFWRRWMVVPFNRTFGDEDADPDLVDKIIDGEKDALMRRAALALDTLVRRGGYDVPGECKDALYDWKRESDSVLQFLCEQSHNYRYRGYISMADDPSDDWILSSDLFQKYKSWCSGWGLHPYGKNRFGRRCTKLLDKKKTRRGVEYRITLKSSSYGSENDDIDFG